MGSAMAAFTAVSTLKGSQILQTLDSNPCLKPFCAFRRSGFVL